MKLPKSDSRVLQQFAWACLLLLPAIVGFFTWRYELSWTWLIVAGAFGALVALIELVLVGAMQSAAGALLERVLVRPLFLGLTLVAFPIGFVVSHLLIALIYYLVITPIALFFRLVGRDVIGRRIDRSLPSYWHDRGKPRPASSYFKLY